MQLYVFDQEQQTGPFPHHVVQAMLNAGSISPEALAWHEGATGWIPVAQALAQASASPAAAGPRVAATREVSTGTAPGANAVFMKAAAAGIGVAIVGGILWAAFGAFVGVQLPYILGCGLAWLCAATIDKVSGGSAGALYLLLTLATVVIGWIVGVLGVAAFGGIPLISLWTIASFVFALMIAWRKATE